LDGKDEFKEKEVEIVGECMDCSPRLASAYFKRGLEVLLVINQIVKLA
jgi:hypothetical protein